MSRRNVLSLDDQGPVRSGLPSGPRGVGARRFGLPSAVRGISGVGTLIQFCASNETDVSDSATTIGPMDARALRSAEARSWPRRADIDLDFTVFRPRRGP